MKESKFLSRLNHWAQELEKAAGKVRDSSHETNLKAKRYLERTEYEVAARTHIKTEGFANDLEREVMLSAAKGERNRKHELESELDSDPLLKMLYEREFNRLRVKVGERFAESVGGLAKLEAGALASARICVEVERACEADPNYRRLYEESLAELSSPTELKD